MDEKKKWEKNKKLEIFNFSPVFYCLVSNKRTQYKIKVSILDFL